MTICIYIAAATGLFIAAHTNGDLKIVNHFLKQTALTSIAVSGGVILSGKITGTIKADEIDTRKI